MRVAIVHHWFLAHRGGERVVDALCELLPQADIYTLFCDSQSRSTVVSKHKMHTSFLNQIIGSRHFYRQLLPLYPVAVKSLNLSGYDLVISSDAGPVKGVFTDSEALHICYCHSPMRCLWDAHRSYCAAMSCVPGIAFRLCSSFVRDWDYRAAQRVKYFVSNSHNVASRVRRYYGRDSAVIYPPVDTHRGVIRDSVDDFYLAVGRLVPYKRTDLVIKACSRLGRRLVVVGDGPELRSLHRYAGPSIKFLCDVTDDQLWQLYSRCRALIIAADEDFGISPVEAQACGRPVIAYGKGGVLETIVDWKTAAGSSTSHMTSSPTGIFFSDQSVDSVMDAILRFEPIERHFMPECIRAHATQFDKAMFMRRFSTYLLRILELEGRSRLASQSRQLLSIPR